MQPVVKLEFSAHDSEDEEGMQRWIVGANKKKQQAVAPASTFVPAAIDRIHYSLDDCSSLLSLLHARSGVWPPSGRVAVMEPSMQKSCLAKLHAHTDG